MSVFQTLMSSIFVDWVSKGQCSSPGICQDFIRKLCLSYFIYWISETNYSWKNCKKVCKDLLLSFITSFFAPFIFLSFCFWVIMEITGQQINIMRALGYNVHIHNGDEYDAINEEPMPRPA